MCGLAYPKHLRSLSGSKPNPSSARATVGTLRATTRQRAAESRNRDALSPRDGCDARHNACIPAALCVYAWTDERTVAKLHRVHKCETNKHPTTPRNGRVGEQGRPTCMTENDPCAPPAAHPALHTHWAGSPRLSAALQRDLHRCTVGHTSRTSADVR